MAQRPLFDTEACMFKHIATRTASSALNRVVEGVLFVAGVTHIVAERAFSATKSTVGATASALGVHHARILRNHTATAENTPSTSSAITEFFEPLEDLSDLENISDGTDEEPDDGLDLSATTEPEVPALALTSSDDSDAAVVRHLEDLVALYSETLENDLPTDGLAPF